MGIYRGFVKEALSLLGWVLAIWGAWRFGAEFSGWVPEFIDDPVARIWVARGGLLIVVLVISGVISSVISFLMGKTGLDGTDRLIGMVFGLGRGLVLAGLAVNLLQVAGFEADSWWQESTVIPYLLPIADSLREITDGGVDLLREGAIQDGMDRLEASSLDMEG